ncbi:hypothetical protein LINPERHAP1_LOCUS7181 [Linum perenne]
MINTPNFVTGIKIPDCFRDNWSLPLQVELRSGALEEFHRCLRFLRQLPQGTVSEGPASLTWPLTSTSEFSVKSFNSQIRKDKFPGVDDFPVDIIWNKVVPVKIQCFLWLCYHNRISTLDVLQSRGFSLPNRCVMCGIDEESSGHLFIHCTFVAPIWSKISSRLSFFGPYPSKVSDLIASWKGLNCLSTFAIIKGVVLHSLCWHIWLERNDVIFRDSSPSESRVFFRTVGSCCAWIKALGRISQIEFEMWMRQLTAT